MKHLEEEDFLEEFYLKLLKKGKFSGRVPKNIPEEIAKGHCLGISEVNQEKFLGDP